MIHGLFILEFIMQVLPLLFLKKKVKIKANFDKMLLRIECDVIESFTFYLPLAAVL